MIEIKNFGVNNSQFVGTEEELFADEGFQRLKQIYDYLEEHGECHVRVNGGTTMRVLHVLLLTKKDITR